jgi:hypothetical protein
MKEERITEYTLLFKEGTKLYEQYNGEFIAENKEETDDIFGRNKEQIEQYFSKDWIRNNEDDDWQEDWVEVLYSI